jgi:hypothetical protein
LCGFGKHISSPKVIALNAGRLATTKICQWGTFLEAYTMPPAMPVVLGKNAIGVSQERAKNLLLSMLPHSDFCSPFAGRSPAANCPSQFITSLARPPPSPPSERANNSKIGSSKSRYLHSRWHNCHWRGMPPRLAPRLHTLQRAAIADTTFILYHCCCVV